MHDNHFPHCCMIFKRAHKSLLLLMNGCLKRKMFFVNLYQEHELVPYVQIHPY